MSSNDANSRARMLKNVEAMSHPRMSSSQNVLRTESYDAV